MNIVVVLNEEEYVLLEDVELCGLDEAKMVWLDYLEGFDCVYGHYIESDLYMTLDELESYLYCVDTFLEEGHQNFLDYQAEEEKNAEKNYRYDEMLYPDNEQDNEDEEGEEDDEDLWYYEEEEPEKEIEIRLYLGGDNGIVLGRGDFTDKNITEYLESLKNKGEKFANCDFLFDDEIYTVPRMILEGAKKTEKGM